MKKISILAIALAVVFAFSVVPASAAKNDTKRFDSTVTVKYTGDDNYGEPAFKGRVESSKNACVVNRKVKVKSLDTDETVGSDETNDQGKYVIDATGFGPGDYRAKAVTKVIKKKNGGKIVCKSASADITVE